MKPLLISSLLLLFVGSLAAQSSNIKGKITDSEDHTDIVGASVILKNPKDSLQKKGVSSNLKGDFSFSNINYGDYVLSIQYLGYKPLIMSVKINQPETKLGTLKLVPDSTTMREVEIEAHIVPMKQNGDTIEYNANAFKTDPDAELEDLLERLPGITVDNGVKAQGEDIQQILVDGRPYFGGDLDAALKNIPAETIDKIQVYYKQSDQAKFTGFDDGQSIKVINIITKPNMRNGEFGRLYAGYATSSLHNASGDLNLFNGNKRITVIGSSASTSAGEGGVSNTNLLGANYGDSLGKKVFLTGSYYFGNNHNKVQSSLKRSYFASNPPDETYSETDASNAFGQNQRLNLRMECHFDTMNYLTFAPAFNVNFTNNTSNTNAETDIGAEPQSITQNNSHGGPGGLGANGSLMFGHRFRKKGRTLSVSLQAGTNLTNGNETLHALNNYPGTTDSVVTLNQESDNYGSVLNISPSLNYTEPLGKNSMLQLNYAYSYDNGQTDRTTFDNDSLAEFGYHIDTPLTNGVNTITITNRTGLAYRMYGKKYSLNLGLEYQSQALSGQNDYFNDSGLTDKKFSAILPSVFFNYQISKKSNINVNYISSTSLPSVYQLQDIINNTNPLLLSTGNPDLRQQYMQNIGVRYGLPVSGAGGVGINISASSTMHSVASSVVTATKDSMLTGGYVMRQGSQLSRPVNLDGAANARAFVSYALPVKKIESNFSLNGGVSYGTAPGLVNNLKGFTNTWTYNASAVLGGYTKKGFDYTLNYSPNYSIVKNTLVPQANNNYFTQNIMARLKWTIWKRLVFNTDFNYRVYSGLNTAYNQSYTLWNASIGKKFFKKENGELVFYVYDILNKQNSLSHTVTDLYIQDRQANVLGRYYMVSFVYQLRNYKKAKVKAE